jgi:uncharacterized protein YbaR (Trm112 family)
MHILLTDRLSCPRCGPEFGLILLANIMANRRVQDGTLGCPNCRDAFLVEDGFGDLRAPPRRVMLSGLAGPSRAPEPEEVQRLAALIGVAQGPGTIVLAGEPAGLGPSIASMLDGVDVVGVDADLRLWDDDARWSRIVSAPNLPFFSRVMRGVAVDGRMGQAMVLEAARVCAPLSRVVVTQAPDQAAAWLGKAGLDLMVAEAGIVVAARH